MGADTIREMGDDDEMGALFVNPIILIPKSVYVKQVIGAQFLNSVTDHTNYPWLLETVQMIMTLVNGKFFSISDLSCAYHQVPLSPETQKLTSFTIGGRLYTYTRAFYGFYYWPRKFDWICALTAEALECQNSKPNPKHLNEVPLEVWHGDTAPFCAILINH